MTTIEGVLFAAIEQLGEYPLAGRIIEELDNPTLASRWWPCVPTILREHWDALSQETRLAIGFWASSISSTYLDLEV
jgi:hypothetical protein